MSNAHDIPSVQPAATGETMPVARAYRQAPRRSGLTTLLRWLFGMTLVISILLNVAFLVIYLPSTGMASSRLTERYFAGIQSADDKIALVRVEGPILGGLTDYATQQLRDAAQDDAVKAIVLNVNSPGGSVTASDEIYKLVLDVRDGKLRKPSGAACPPKPIVVAMGGIAASGGYYIAVPAQAIFAEPTTITGSIGVYAPFVDLHELAEKNGVKVRILKKGELKGSGSLFQKMTPDEEREYDELLETTYQRFMRIVREGRGKKLKYGLRDEIKLESQSRKGEAYVRRLADGGVFTAEQAREFGLVDRIGYLEDAITEAQRQAGIEEARVISYSRPLSLTEALLGLEAAPPDLRFDLDRIPGLTARMWYLTPGYELSGNQVPKQLLE